MDGGGASAPRRQGRPWPYVGLVPPKAGAPPSIAIDDRFGLFGPYQRV